MTDNVGGFQGFLIDKGWKRYTVDYYKGQDVVKENYTSDFISTYGPLCYYFSHVDFPDVRLWWGLEEYKKPPTFFLKCIHVQCNDFQKTQQDMYNILMQTFTNEELYQFILDRGKGYVEITFKEDEQPKCEFITFANISKAV